MPFCARRVKDEPEVSTWSPYELRFSEHHTWARLDEGSKDVVAIGLSDFGQRSLGDILGVELPKVGDQVTAAPRWAGSTATAAHSTSSRPCRER